MNLKEAFSNLLFMIWPILGIIGAIVGIIISLKLIPGCFQNMMDQIFAPKNPETFIYYSSAYSQPNPLDGLSGDTLGSIIFFLLSIFLFNACVMLFVKSVKALVQKFRE